MNNAFIAHSNSIYWHKPKSQKLIALLGSYLSFTPVAKSWQAAFCKIAGPANPFPPTHFAGPILTSKEISAKINFTVAASGRAPQTPEIEECGFLPKAATPALQSFPKEVDQEFRLAAQLRTFKQWLRLTGHCLEPKIRKCVY